MLWNISVSVFSPVGSHHPNGEYIMYEIPKKAIDEIQRLADKTGLTTDDLTTEFRQNMELFALMPEKEAVKSAYVALHAKYKNVWKSADDIPTYSDDIPPIDIQSFGIPVGNFILRFCDYIEYVTDTYPEYTLCSALSSISVVAQRRVYFSLASEEFFTNLWILIMGYSGYARKSTSVKKAKRHIKKSCGNLFLPEDVNPASLLDNISTTIKHKTTEKGKNEKIWVDELLAVPDEKRDISRAHRMLIKDEAGQLLSQLEGQTHKAMKDTLLRLYDPDDYTKDLRDKSIIIKEPYFSIYWGSTPETIKKYMTKDDFKSGFLARMLSVNPSYKKQRKDLNDSNASDDPTIADFEMEIESALACIDRILRSSTTQKEIDGEGNIINKYKPLRARLDKISLQMLNDWVAEREEYYALHHDEIMSAITARMQGNIIKLALLIELGNLPWLTAGAQEPIKIKEFIIGKCTMESALKMIDAIFLPYAIKLSRDLSDENASASYTGSSKMVRNLEKKLISYRKKEKSLIYHECGIKKEDYAECEDTLMDMGVLQVHTVITKENKWQPWYVYTPLMFGSEHFKHNYSKTRVSEYTTHGIKYICFGEKIEEVVDQTDEQSDW